jgi:hypothetical protein
MDYNNWTISTTRNFSRLLDLFEGQREARDEGEELLQDLRCDIGDSSFANWIHTILKYETVSTRTTKDSGSTPRAAVNQDRVPWNVELAWDLTRSYTSGPAGLDPVTIAEDAIEVMDSLGFNINNRAYEEWKMYHYERLNMSRDENVIPDDKLYNAIESGLCSTLIWKDESSRSVTYWICALRQHFPDGWIAGYPDLECSEVSERVIHIFRYVTQKMPAAFFWLEQCLRHLDRMSHPEAKKPFAQAKLEILPTDKELSTPSERYWSRRIKELLMEHHV